MAEARLGKDGSPLVVIIERQDLSPHLGVKAEKPQISRNRGSGGAAEPGELGLGVGFASVQELAIVTGLLERIAVFYDLQAARTAGGANLDVGYSSPNSLKNLELIANSRWFSKSNLWATNCCDSTNS